MSQTVLAGQGWSKERACTMAKEFTVECQLARVDPLSADQENSLGSWSVSSSLQKTPAGCWQYGGVPPETAHMSAGEIH